MSKQKKNYLLEKIVEVISARPAGKVLDLGCGDGRTGKRLLDAGFQVEACDMDEERFELSSLIPFKRMNLNEALPYVDNSFDYVILMEVVEHIYNPGFVIGEIARILKPGGKIILSTPNILNIGSRLRFLFEGSFDFFREPTLDFSQCFPMAIQNMHVIPWRYQELEYLLYQGGLETENCYTDKIKGNFLLPALIFKPFLYFQAWSKDCRTKKKKGVSFTRMNRILMSDELLLGRHIIMEAVKK